MSAPERRTRRIIAASHFSPVMSPAWRMRRALWPPSRVRSQEPSGRRANFTPQSIRSWMPAGAFSQISCTTSVRPSQAPAIIVSRAWRSKLSAGSRPLVTSVTLP